MRPPEVAKFLILFVVLLLRYAFLRGEFFVNSA